MVHFIYVQSRTNIAASLDRARNKEFLYLFLSLSKRKNYIRVDLELWACNGNELKNEFEVNQVRKSGFYTFQGHNQKSEIMELSNLIFGYFRIL